MNSATGTLKPKTEVSGRRRPIDTVRAGLARRYARERRFRILGLLAVVTSFVCVGLLFISIIATGYQAIWQTRIRLMVNLDPEVIDPEGKRDPRPYPQRITEDWSRARSMRCSPRSRREPTSGRSRIS